MISGIYKITNSINGFMYIGSAININRRFIEHKKLLRHNKHPNKYFQYAWSKYNENNFEFCIIELVYDKTKLVEREQYWLDTIKCYDRKIGYNQRSKAESNLGYKFSEEFRQKRIKIQTGKKPSEETKAKMSASHKGQKRPANIGELISKAKKGKGVGRKIPDTVKANMRIAQQKRRYDETAKIIFSVTVLKDA